LKFENETSGNLFEDEKEVFFLKVERYWVIFGLKLARFKS